MLQPMTNVEALVKCVDANSSADSAAPVLILAGGTGDGVKITGETVDTQGYSSVAVVTGYLAALADTKTLSFAIDMKLRKRYIRFNVTPDMSATGTDTATFHTIAVMGGANVLPAA